MAEDRLDKVLTTLGQLMAGQEHASEGRKILHSRMDDMVELVKESRDATHETNRILDQTNFALRVTTDIATQTRDRFDQFKKKFDEEATPLIEGVSTFQEDAAPVLEQIKKARAALMVLIAVLGFGGLTTVSIVAFANDQAKAIVRDWLDLSSVPPID